MTRNELAAFIGRQVAEYKSQLKVYLDVFDLMTALQGRSDSAAYNELNTLQSRLMDVQDELNRLVNRHKDERQLHLFDADSYRELDDPEY